MEIRQSLRHLVDVTVGFEIPVGSKVKALRSWFERYSSDFTEPLGTDQYDQFIDVAELMGTKALPTTRMLKCLRGKLEGRRGYNFVDPHLERRDLLSYLRAGDSAALIFNHGLGDLVNFMPVFEALKKARPDCYLRLVADEARQFHFLFPEILHLCQSTVSLLKKFNYIFRVEYPEPPYESEVSKPYLCALQEMGLKDFEWKPLQIVNQNTSKSGLVGVHFTGNTNYDVKNPTSDVSEVIWNEIKKAGFEPFEVHMKHTEIRDDDREYAFVGNNTLRYQGYNLCSIRDKILECAYFIGVDSGPLYLAVALLGKDKCIALEKFLKVKRYFPEPLDVVDVSYYEEGTIEKILKGRQNGNSAETCVDGASVEGTSELPLYGVGVAEVRGEKHGRGSK